MGDTNLQPSPLEIKNLFSSRLYRSCDSAEAISSFNTVWFIAYQGWLLYSLISLMIKYVYEFTKSINTFFFILSFFIVSFLII